MLNSDNDTINVRRAGPADVPRIAILFDQLGYPGASDGLAGRLAQQLADPATSILAACFESQLAGILVMHVIRPLHVAHAWAVISSLVVDERLRSSGAGAALIAAAEEIATASHCAHLELSCSERRTRAHAFYEARGFVEVRKRFMKKIATGS